MRLEQYINGTFQGGDGPSDAIIDPARGEVMTSLKSASPSQIDKSFVAAHQALRGWRQTTPGERAKVLLAIADLIEKSFEPLAQLEARNTGKPLNRVKEDELATVVDPFRFYAGAIRCQTMAAPGEYVPGYVSISQREPLGVVALIIPWNYPLMMACWKIAPALAAGNTIVLKPSEQTPLSMLALMDLIGDLLPPGVLNVVTGTGELVGAAMSKHPLARLVSITGAIETGVVVAKQAADSIKRVHLELGGKAPVIVFPDADLEAAAETACQAGFYNAGQDCTAACRIFVHRDIAASFTDLYTAKVGGLTTGNPDDPDLSFGSLISKEHYERVDGFVQRAIKNGNVSVLRFGEADVKNHGYYYYPTVFTDVPWDHELVQQEIFGPVTSITTFDESDSVVDWCNDTEYGLAASVWTKDNQRALSVSRALEYGCIWVNTHLMWPTEMPHGGYKKSGFGKEMSIYGLEDYQNVKHIMNKL